MFASEFVTTQFKYSASMSFVLGKKNTYTGIYILSSSSIGDLNFAMIESWRHDDDVFHEIYFSTFLNIWHVSNF